MGFSCLQARAHKKEIILFCFNSATVWEAANLIFNLRDLGYDHWVGVTDNTPSMCDIIRKVMPNGACGWSSQQEAFPGTRPRPSDPFEMKQFTLWFYTARIVRLGYNVLAIDVDTTTHQDVYQYFKKPPFATMNWIYQV